jgi:hypothetical protein
VRRQIHALKGTVRRVVVRDCATLFRSLNAQVVQTLCAPLDAMSDCGSGR